MISARKMKSIILSILVIIISSCGNYKETNEIPFFFENKLSFHFLKHEYDTSNNWIKEPANIQMLHSTFKAIGYIEILDYLDYTEDWTLQINNTRSLENLIDSLEMTYQDENAPKYYKEFWQRRIKENNQEVVYKVIDEIKTMTLGEAEATSPNSKLVNDTLKYLAQIELQDSLSSYVGNEYLDYLIKMKMHQSAWNVRSGENSKFDNIKWHTESSKIYEKLKVSKKYMNPWIIDNTK